MVTAANAKTHKLTVKVGTHADTFLTSASTAVTVAGKKGTVAALKAGEHVQVTYTGTGASARAPAVVTKA